MQNRRGIYLLNKRSVRLPLLSAFDQPDTITSCPVRPVSTHALQALSLFNSSFMQEVSHDFAARLEKSCGDRQGVRGRYRMAAGAGASSAQGGEAGCESSSGSPAPLQDFCLAILNRNEFLYVP